MIAAPFRHANARADLLAAAGLGAAFAADPDVRRTLQPHLSAGDRDRAHTWSAWIEPRHEMGVAIGLYGAGLLSGVDPVRETGLRGGEALLLTEGMTILLKRATGRERPFRDRGSASFHPFGGSTSLPSGHASSAFALATVVSRMSGRPLVSAAAYGVAGSVAAARVIQDVHWTSDVAAGAMVGILAGRVATADRRSASADAEPPDEAARGEKDSGASLHFRPSVAPLGIAFDARF